MHEDTFDFEALAAEFIQKKMPRGHMHTKLERYQNFTKGERFALLCLMHMDAHGSDKMFPGDIAQLTQTSTARIAAVLGKLEDKGYIVRETDPDDRRRVSVSLTKAGRAAITREQNEMVKIIAQIFRRMGERDTKQFLRLFETFFTYMAEDFPDCGQNREQGLNIGAKAKEKKVERN